MSLDPVTVKGVITWVGMNDAVPAEGRLYERLFVEAHPEAGGKVFLEKPEYPQPEGDAGGGGAVTGCGQGR